MRGEVKKWGNSLAVRLPRDLANSLHLSEGSALELELVGGGLLLRAARPRRHRLTFEELLEGLTPETAHGEVEWGVPRGREAW